MELAFDIVAGSFFAVSLWSTVSNAVRYARRVVYGDGVPLLIFLATDGVQYSIGLMARVAFAYLFLFTHHLSDTFEPSAITTLYPTHHFAILLLRTFVAIPAFLQVPTACLMYLMVLPTVPHARILATLGGAMLDANFYRDIRPTLLFPRQKEDDLSPLLGREARTKKQQFVE